MTRKISEIINRIKTDKKLFIIVLAGIVGVVLLVLSELLPEENKDEPKPEKISVASETNNYEAELENRLTELIESINGAGKTKVMLTVDCGDENVYATENKTDNGKNETEYVLVETDGNNSGMLLKVWMPEIRGVAIVCQGADSAKVREEITGVVTAVLGISTNRVNIAKMNNDSGG
jgi:stage III sporulation protein AG